MKYETNFKLMKNQNFGLLLLRIAIGGLMLFHGINKLFHGVEGIAGMLAGKGLPEFIAYGVYIGEVIAPLLIVLGYRTRLASVVFVINMLVIVFVAHANELFALSPHGGLKLELTALYLFGALVLFFTGAGKFAVSHHNKWD